MSFFGFDPTGPPKGGRDKDEAYDFENTYDGLGELEEDDVMNSETFGTSTQDIRKDFNFGHDNSKEATPSAAAPAPSSQGVSYAQAASHPVNDDEFMQDLWGSSNAPSNQQQEQQQQQQSGASGKPEKKILSLEEIEAQLTAIDQSQQPQQQVPPPQQQQQQQFPPQPYAMPGMMPPPPQFGYMMAPGFIPPQYGYPGMIPQQMPPMPQQQQQQPQQVPPQQQQSQQEVAPSQPQPQQQQQQQQQAPQGGQQIRGSPSEIQNTRRPQKVDLSQFPVLGSKEAQQQQQNQLTQQQQSHNQYHQHQHQQHQQQQQQQHYVSHGHYRQPLEELTPEQQEKAAKRQEKVSRIMKYSGIMNPKDKDFVTRFQLSQIVTEDPYNEDFYAQVFKVIHPKANNGVQQQHQHENNSIAQAYLDHSGHRLGGRYKRADVALQRMQQQVQKAVAVAKERPKLTQYAKEGALGKISVGGGKTPRQQLVIVSKAVEREQLQQQQQQQQQQQEQKSQRKEGTKSYAKKDILSTLENIICELMNVESESRTKQDVDTTKLWDSLKVLEQPSSSGDEENEVNPFIQCLNYNKMLKILLRLFKFLNREQVLTIVTLIMSNLENLSVIKNGSYTTYPDKKVPENILKLVDSYSLTFSKILMNSVLEFKFNEIIGLLVILIEHNNVSFVSTTKIGLSILTTLLSRAELIIGEGTISATDLSEWSSCYDELFTSLESRIQAIFPPNFDELDDGTSRENYIWQFLATLSLGGKLSHQRIIVDEVRDEIFGVMNRAKKIDNSDYNNLYKKQNLLNNLNMYLVVMGLVADENDIKELQQ